MAHIDLSLDTLAELAAPFAEQRGITYRYGFLLLHLVLTLAASRTTSVHNDAADDQAAWDIVLGISRGQFTPNPEVDTAVFQAVAASLFFCTSNYPYMDVAVHESTMSMEAAYSNLPHAAYCLIVYRDTQ